MDYTDKLSEEELRRLNLDRSSGDLRITWPQSANIYHMTLGRHLGPGSRGRTAVVFETPDGVIETMSFAEVEQAASSLAAYLAGLGYGAGDLIALHTGQHPDTAVAHMAICKLGAVAVTLSQLYGPDTLSHALNDCRAPVILTDEAAWSSLRGDAPATFPHLKHVLLRTPQAGELDLAKAFRTSSDGFTATYRGADDPALLMYTSGSTGKPKGILHGHRVLASYTPSINLFFDLSMEDDDAVYWSPSDWAWVGGLLDMLFPAWMAGRTIATSLDRFKADWAYRFMEKHKVTHTFLAPTAIKRLAQTQNPREDYDLSLRVICTGGEALAAETLEWAEQRLGVVCNEFYGMTEVNHLIGNCAALFPRKPGSMGRAYPGHDVRLVDGDGLEVGDGEPGEIVTTADAPTRFLGYLNNPDKEAEMRHGEFLRTHDLAVRDADGYYWYKGRSDDLIKSSGFRIGPAEIEDCLLAHPCVAETAVVGKPDADRGSIVKAFIKLRAGEAETEALKDALTDHVRDRLAAYKAPREIEFVNEFEMTSSGKINRRILREAEQKKAGV
ncbi:acyl-CoA synthetase [Hoeflea prorocentri]|uniref:AMP-binding protein n=1 Tax=Hoeflea prorocentri TaxID=1922333 RepID=A0A9X3UJD3_9HYPH|nr:AMP-binding protein [Hoeflea prorocentri]MCY6379821.1 AMP-binding protein [Hoeflea prorocentri]MDA5397621.1 AMP-binding protein [Hoeflea prorocentri]